MSYSVKTWKKKPQTNSKNMKCHSTGLSKLFTWCYQCRKVRYDASLFSRFSCPSKRHIRPLCTDNIQEKVVVIYIKLLSISLSLYYPFSFLCCHIMCLYVLSSLLWCLLRFPYQTISGSSLHPVVCRRAHIVFTLFVFVCA
jgi:hypothetical protein